MTTFQLLKACEFIEKQFDELTMDKYEDLSAGDGLYSIVEKAVEQAFGEDKASLEDFWNRTSLTHSISEKADICNLQFQVIDHFYNQCHSRWYRHNIYEPKEREITVANRRVIISMGDINKICDDTTSITTLSDGTVKVVCDYKCPDKFGNCSYTTIIFAEVDSIHIL